MAAPGENMRVNADRLWDSLMDMAKIGPGVAGGNNRQTLTDADAEGRSLFKRWCEAAGMSMGVDTMGNMFATRAGTDPSALPVYMGSHLDTQPTGGKYDGVLGVLGALEVVRTLNDMGVKTKHPIVVTNWTNEEGARFAPAMLASGVFAGIHTEEYAKSRKDLDGKVFGEELARIGEIVSNLPVFHDYDDEALVKTAEACGEILSADGGLRQVLRLVREALPEKLRETAYAVALEVAAADRTVKPEEIRFLELLGEALELDNMTTAAIERGIRARNMTL